MKCPNCEIALVMSERQGVEIDYCPECRGVWLDRGELDKIIERSEQKPSAIREERDFNRTETSRNDHEEHHRGDERDHQDSYYNGKPRKQKRESFLADIFDFGG